MRTCHNCGYLVPDSWNSCRRCNSLLASPSNDALSTVRLTGTNSFGNTLANSLGTSSGAVALQRHALDAAADASRARAPVKHTRITVFTTGRLVALAVLVVLLGAGKMGWGYVQGLLDQPPGELQDFVHGAGVTYAPEAGGYAIRLPGVPTEDTVNTNIGGRDVLVPVGRLAGGNWELVAAHVPVGPIAPEQLEATLSSAVVTLVSPAGGRVTDPDSGTRGGYRVLAVSVDTGTRERVSVRIVYDGVLHAYVFSARAQGGAEKVVEEMVDSFRVV